MNSKPPAPAAGAPAGSDADDAIVDDLVAQALDLVRDRIAPEHLSDFEGALYDFYETSPAGVQLVEQLRDAPRVARSGTVTRAGDEALAEAFVRTGLKGTRGQ
jgi:hypothetical protein